MADAINALFSASNLAPPPDSFRVVSANDGDVICVRPERLLGTQPLDVEVQCTMAQLQGQVSHLGEEIRRLQTGAREESSLIRAALVATAKGPLRAVAAQVLDVAFEFTKMEAKTCTRVQSLSSSNPTVIKLAQMASKKPDEFQKLADDIITRRNNDAAHWTSVKALDSEVQTCQSLLALPEVRQQYEWEVWIVENYNAIKEACPAQFKLPA